MTLCTVINGKCIIHIKGTPSTYGKLWQKLRCEATKEELLLFRAHTSKVVMNTCMMHIRVRLIHRKNPWASASRRTSVLGEWRIGKEKINMIREQHNGNIDLTWRLCVCVSRYGWGYLNSFYGSDI